MALVPELLCFQVAPSLSFDYREKALTATAVFSVPVGISGLMASPSPSLGYLRQKANPG